MLKSSKVVFISVTLKSWSGRKLLDPTTYAYMYVSSRKGIIIIFLMVIKLEISRQVLEKYSNIKFYENLSNGSRVVPCGHTRTDGRMNRQTDRHVEASSRFSQFCKQA